MCTQRDILYARHTLTQITEQRLILMWQRITNSVRNVDRRCTRVNGSFCNTAQIITVTARGILRGEFDAGAELARVRDHGFHLLQSLFAAHLELVAQMYFRGRKKHMDYRLFGLAHSFPGGLDISGISTR